MIGKNRIRRWLACVAMALALSVPAMAKVQVDLEDWGLGGAVKGGLWSYLYVVLTSTGEDFSGTLEVEANAGHSVVPLFVKPIQLVAEMPARHWVYFRAPASTYRNPMCRLSWVLRNAAGQAVMTSEWRRPVLLPAADTVVAVFRSGDIQNAALGGLLDTTSEVQTHALMISLPMAPDRALGYESADALVWLDPDPTRLATPAQADAIVNYIRQGGHLVLGAGSGWQALSESFLSKLLPATPVASFLSSDVSGLQAYRPPEKIDPFTLMRLTRVRGEVAAQQGGYPLIVHGRVGMGRVTLIAFDPTKAPFTDFQARERFWADVLQIEVAHHDAQTVGAISPASATMIQALNDFPGIKPVNFWFVGLFLAGYVILIGPVDYFVLKRLKKLHWTWATFPCVAVLFSVIAFTVMASGRVLSLAANSVSIVDAEQGNPEVSGTTFMTFLSPQQTQYRVTVASPAVGVVTPLEFDFGGMMRSGPSLSASNCAVVAPGERGQFIDGLLVRVWDAQTVQSAWRAPSGDLPEVKASLDSSGQYHVVADNKTSDALTDAALLVRGGILQLGTIPAKQSRDQGGMTPMPLPAYVQSLRSGSEDPNSGLGGTAYYNRVLPREQAGRQARWLSLFGAGAADSAQPVFTRWIQPNRPENTNTPQYNRFSSSAYDLPARLQLPPLAKDEAILLYSTTRAFAWIELTGRSPNNWNVTLVRLRVPVSIAPQP